MLCIVLESIFHQVLNDLEVWNEKVLNIVK